MISKWTSHLSTPEEQKQFAGEVQGSKRVFDRLRDILKEKDAELTRTELTSKIYDTPNWGPKQAHTNGYRECLFLMKRLIDLDQKDN